MACALAAAAATGSLVASLMYRATSCQFAQIARCWQMSP
jgi:hypothetical protein